MGFICRSWPDDFEDSVVKFFEVLFALLYSLSNKFDQKVINTAQENSLHQLTNQN